jgi:hypothetical protein
MNPAIFDENVNRHDENIVAFYYLINRIELIFL